MCVPITKEIACSPLSFLSFYTGWKYAWNVKLKTMNDNEEIVERTVLGIKRGALVMLLGNIG